MFAKAEKRTILIVEDDAMMRNVIKNKLADESLVILEAENGWEALAVCIENKPSLILLDLMLPQVDGYELMEQLRKNPEKSISSVPIVIFSNFDDPEHIEKAKSYNVNEFYMKNKTDVDRLCNRIQQILEET
jgi:two-component system alkaline phosphatase synthesis response regulator PhoP